jgi:hypothetical protein
MTKKPAPKKPAAKMPTIPRKKPPLHQSVDDIMQELDAAVSSEEGGKTGQPDLSAVAPAFTVAQEDAGKTTAAASETAKPAVKRSRPPNNLRTMMIIYPYFDKHPALQSYAGRFLDACFAILDNPYERANFRDVKKRLTALSLDDPGRLDQIRAAIAASSLEPDEQLEILSMFEMAVALLYDIEGP